MTHGTCLSIILVMVTLIPCGPAHPQNALPDSALPDATADSAGLSPLETGKAHYEQGRFDEALVHFERAVDQNGRSAPAHYWLGMTQYALGDFREALSSFRKTTRQDKGWAPGHVGIGKSYLKLKNRKLDARNALRTAVRLDPYNADAQYHLGMSFMNVKKVDAIVGSDRDGRMYFLKAVELNPHHPDAFYQLGRCYDRFPEPEYGNAMEAYFNQYRANPDHGRAFERFANVCFRTEAFEKGAELLRQLAEESGDAVTDEARSLQLQFSLLSGSSERQFDRLQEALETYISSLDSEEQAVYRDLSHVAPPDELNAWENAEGSERDAMWQAFWDSRDSNPATVENERLVEHYRRVLFARSHFSEGQYPYDRRGEIYVRYGTPDDRRPFLMRRLETTFSVFQPSANPAVDAIRERNMRSGYVLRVGRGDPVGLLEEEAMQLRGFDVGPVDLWASSSEGDPFSLLKRLVGETYKVESWVYVPHNMELFFVDQMGGGKFDYPLQMIYEGGDSLGVVTGFRLMQRFDTHHPQRVAANLIKRSPEEYRHDFDGEPLQYAFDTVSFRGEGGSTEVDFSYSIPAWQFGEITDEKDDRTWLNNQITLRDSVQTPVYSRKFRFGPVERPERQPANQEFQGSAFMLAAKPTTPSGTFTLAVEMRDEATQRIGVYKKQVSFSDYHGNDLLISDLKLSTGISPTSGSGPFTRKGLDVTPNPGRLYAREQLVYVYYEVYNLNMDEGGRTSFETLYEITPMGMPALRNRRARRPDDMQTVMSFFEGEGSSAEEAEYTALDTTDLDAGEYVLTVTLTDRHVDQSVTKSVNFMVVEP